MPTSPPSTAAPPPSKGGSGPLIGAIVVMLLLTGGLIVWKVSGGKETATPTQPPKAVATTAAPVFEEPPPPPPEVKVEDAGKPTKVVRGGGKFVGADPCSKECAGTAPAALRSALQGRAGQSRRCYERALLQNATLEGRLTVSVRVGPTGAVCGSSIASNSLGDPAVANCVLGVFRSGTFPAPQGGCVDTQVPINFVPRKN